MTSNRYKINCFTLIPYLLATAGIIAAVPELKQTFPDGLEAGLVARKVWNTCIPTYKDLSAAAKLTCVRSEHTVAGSEC